MAQLTMLTEMMSPDLETAIARLRDLGISLLDLKGGLFGKSVENLDAADNERLAALLERTGTRAYCLSSVLGHRNVSQVSEADFRRTLETGLVRLMPTARALRPARIRLLGCCFDGRGDWRNANDYLKRHAPWVYAAYRDAVAQLHDAGWRVTIENEPGSIFAAPGETLEFFERLDRADGARFTWDIQNMWQSGTYPTPAVYEQLRPVTDYVHLKGGRAAPAAPRVLAHRSVLEDADWPVREIVGRVLADGTSPVLCLNCSHGTPADDDPLRPLWGAANLAAEEARRDVAFLRRTFAEIE